MADVPPKIRLVLEKITPERALDLLTGNTENRIIRPHVIEAYARDMKSGRWRDGQGEPIHYDPKTETLGNGQHRLLAIIESETTQYMPFLYAPLDWRLSADQGIHRTFGDVLKINYREGDYHSIAASIRYLWEYRRSGEFGGSVRTTLTPPTDSLPATYLGKPTVSELEEIYLTEKGLRDYSLWKSRLHAGGVPIFPSLFVTLTYIFHEIDYDDAEDFSEKVTSGADLSEENPILALRRVMQNDNRPHRAKIQAALVIKSWNSYRNGENVKVLTYRPGGKNPEQFPTIDGSDTVKRRSRRMPRRKAT